MKIIYKGKADIGRQKMQVHRIKMHCAFIKILQWIVSTCDKKVNNGILFSRVKTGEKLIANNY